MGLFICTALYFSTPFSQDNSIKFCEKNTITGEKITMIGVKCTSNGEKYTNDGAKITSNGEKFTKNREKNTIRDTLRKIIRG